MGQGTFLKELHICQIPTLPSMIASCLYLGKACPQLGPLSWALAGVVCTMAVIFGIRKRDKLPFKFAAIWQIILQSHYEIFCSTGTRRLLDEKATRLGSWGSTSLCEKFSTILSFLLSHLVQCLLHLGGWVKLEVV